MKYCFSDTTLGDEICYMYLTIANKKESLMQKSIYLNSK